MQPPPKYDMYCPRCGTNLGRVDAESISANAYGLTVDPVPMEIHQATSPECAGQTEVRLEQVISPLTPADA